MNNSCSKSQENLIAKLLGFTLKEYRYVKKVILNGTIALQNAVDYKQIPLKIAAKISESPPLEQEKLLKAWKSKNQH